MIKKILSVCLSGAMLLSSAVYAAEPDGKEHRMLQTLGITGEKLSSKITCDTFLNALMGFMYEPGNRPVNAETFAKSTGMIGTVETYNGRENISVGKAVKFCVIALGCGMYVQTGSENEYISIGASKGLMSGITASGSEILSNKVMLTLLSNLLEAAPMKYDGDGYAEALDETLLSMYRDIHIVEGLFAADEVTSIYSENGVNENEIQIGDNVFSAETGYDTSLLGMNVTAFVRDNGRDEPSLISMFEDEGENKTLTIDGRSVDSVSDDFRSIDYFEEYNGRVKTAKLAGSISVIYNGVFYDGYEAIDFMPDNGSITLVDTDRDSKYDIVHITAYETMVVDGINTSTKVISNKYVFDEARDILDLDPEKSEVNYRVIKDGEEVPFSTIKINDVLNVAMSRSGETPVCTIYVSSESVQTVILSGINDDNEIETEEDTYIVSEALKKNMAEKNEQLKMGESYYLYFDAFGNIAYFRKFSENEYVLLFKVTSNEDVEEEVYVKYMNLDGDWNTAKCARRVNNGEKSVYPSEIYKKFKGVDPQVVILNTNSDGEISKIVTAKETAAYLEGVFTKTKPSTIYYRSEAKTFASQYYITGTTMMFVVPETYTGEEEDYYVMSANDYFNGNAQYTISAYDVDAFGFTELLVLTEDSSLRSDKMRKSLFVVTDVAQAITADGDVAGKITGSGGGLRNISFLSEDESVYGDLEKGDIINFNMSRNGRVTAKSVLTNIRNAFENKSLSSYHIGSGIIMGTVSDIDIAEGKIKINTGSETGFRLPSTIPCIDYYPEDNKCELISSYDLMKGDKVVCRIAWSNIAEIVRVSE